METTKLFWPLGFRVTLIALITLEDCVMDSPLEARLSKWPFNHLATSFFANSSSLGTCADSESFNEQNGFGVYVLCWGYIGIMANKMETTI